MAFTPDDNTRYYVVKNESVSLQSSQSSKTYLLSAREDGTRCFYDDDGQIFLLPGPFTEKEMSDNRSGASITHGELKAKHQPAMKKDGFPTD